MRVERTIELPVAPAVAWEVLVDWERQADWMLDADRVEVVSAAREGVGVRLAVRTRIAGIPAFTEPMEVSDWEPPRHLQIRHGGPVAGTGTWSLSATTGGTRFDWTEEVRLRIPVIGEAAARCYRPVMRVLMDRAMQGLRSHVIATGPGRAG